MTEVKFVSTRGFSVVQRAGPTSPDNLRSIQGASKSSKVLGEAPFHLQSRDLRRGGAVR